jgi:hypothetical protein
MPMMADNYRDALKSYLQKGNVIDESQYKQMFMPLAQSLYPNEADKVAGIFGEYLSTKLVDDLVDIYMPSFTKHVTEAELAELTEIFSNPRYADITKRSSSVVTNMQQSPEYQKFMGEYQQAMMDIMQGKTPKNIAVPANISEEYIKEFNQYYKGANIDGVVSASFKSMSGMLVNMLKQQGISNAEEIVDKLIVYTDKNMPSVMVAIFHNTLTLQDIQDLSSLTKNTAYQHALQAVAEISSNPMQLGATVISKMADWMQVTHPQYAEPLKKTAKQLQSL